jgi:hypothetical protein
MQKEIRTQKLGLGVNLVKDDDITVVFRVNVPWLSLLFRCSFESCGVWNGSRKSLITALESGDLGLIRGYFGVDISLSEDWIVIAQVGDVTTSDYGDLSGFAYRYQMPLAIWRDIVTSMRMLLLA